MDREKIMDAMDYIDPALVEAADQPVRGRADWRRSALIAACLCLILAGTAAAVEISKIRVTNVSNNSYELVGGINYIPADSLSEEVNQLAQENPRETSYLAAGSWSAAEELIGRNLLDNPVLDTASKYGLYKGGSAQGACLIMVGSNDKGVTMVSALTGYLFQGGSERVVVELDANFRTDLFAEMNKGQPEDEITWERTYFPSGADVTQEDYVTPSGLETIIFRIPSEYYSARFTLNGVRFKITASYYTSVDEAFALETLKTVLDACAVETKK